jgi:hypothetical protein
MGDLQPAWPLEGQLAAHLGAAAEQQRQQQQQNCQHSEAHWSSGWPHRWRRRRRRFVGAAAAGKLLHLAAHGLGCAQIGQGDRPIAGALEGRCLQHGE